MADYHLDLTEVTGSLSITLRALRFRVFELETLDRNANSLPYEKYIDVPAYVQRVEFDIMNKHLSVADKNQIWLWSIPPKHELILNLHSNEGPYKSFQGYLGVLPPDLISGEFDRPGPFTFTFIPDQWRRPAHFP